jgi:hypothetical protein
MPQRRALGFSKTPNKERPRKYNTATKTTATTKQKISRLATITLRYAAKLKVKRPSLKIFYFYFIFNFLNLFKNIILFININKI